MDADVVVWHDLGRGTGPAAGPPSPSTGPLRRPHRRRRGRAQRGARAGRAVARHGVPALPVVAELRGGARPRRGRQPGRRAARWRRAARGRACTTVGGAGGAGARAAADPAARVPVRRHRRAGQGAAARPVGGAAGAAGAGGARRRRGRRRHGELRRVRRLHVGRAAVATPAAPGSGDEPPGYRAFATWDPLPTLDEARSFAEFWRWLSGVRGPGRRVRPQLRRLLLQRAGREPLAARFGAALRRPARGARAWPRWRSSSAIRLGRHLRRRRRVVPLRARARGSSASPPRPGSLGAIPRRAGRTRCAGTAMPSASTAQPPDPGPAERLLEYNADDVAATHALRDVDDLARRSRRFRWPPICDGAPARARSDVPAS